MEKDVHRIENQEKALQHKEERLEVKEDLLEKIAGGHGHANNEFQHIEMHPLIKHPPMTHIQKIHHGLPPFLKALFDGAHQTAKKIGPNFSITNNGFKGDLKHNEHKNFNLPHSAHDNHHPAPAHHDNHKKDEHHDNHKKEEHHDNHGKQAPVPKPIKIE